eukprot:299994_1
MGILLLTFVAIAYGQSEYDECMSFLLDNMPPRDVGNVLQPVLNETITYALLTKHHKPFTQWTSDIPFDIFKNYVLPYATLSEARDNWRKYFYNTLLPIVSNFSINVNTSDRSNITLWIINNLNKHPIFKNKDLIFVPDQEPERISSFEVLTYEYSSCTGYSNLFTNMLRSIGIPTRIVGIPHWNCNCSGCNCTGPFECNHNWIEIYDNNGYWSYTDAYPTNYQVMNDTWFSGKDVNCAIPGNTNYSIFASSFAHTDGTHFIMEWEYSATYVPAWDVTLNYKTDIDTDV